MKKVIGIIVMVLVMVTMTVTANAKEVNDTTAIAKLTEKVITENVITEEIKDENEEKIPNYVIELGGEKFISIKVNRHFGWIQSLIDAGNATANWCGETTKNVGESITNATINVIDTVTNWFDWLKGKEDK